MGCDQSKDEILITDYDDFGEDFYKEPEKKGFNIYQKDYYFWVWTSKNEKNNDNNKLLYEPSEFWMPFAIDISKNLEHSYLAREKTYCLKSLKRKLVFDFENKLLKIFYSKKEDLEKEAKEIDSIRINQENNNYSDAKGKKGCFELFADNINEKECKN